MSPRLTNEHLCQAARPSTRIGMQIVEDMGRMDTEDWREGGREKGRDPMVLYVRSPDIL